MDHLDLMYRHFEFLAISFPSCVLEQPRMASSSRGTLNIPRGNSTITADPAEDELQSGDRVQDYKKAFKVNHLFAREEHI